MTAMRLIILGCGGHARVITQVAEAMSEHVKIAGYSDINKSAGTPAGRYEILGTDDDLAAISEAHNLTHFIVGLGSVKGGHPLRQKIYDAALKSGLKAATLVHPTAIIAPDVMIGAGTVIMPGAVVNCGAIIGKNSIINTRAGIDHDCVIGDHVHIAPGVTLSGDVKVGERTLIGTGANVIQGMSIGADCTIGAGATVISDITDKALALGSLAKIKF